MKAFVNRLIFVVVFRWWLFRTMLPHLRGRLYVFRDAPDWFIKEVTLAASASHEELSQLDDELIRYLREAIAEYKLRFPA